jgi:hypothetical protein
MLRAGFETAISTFERPKTVLVLDRSAIETGNCDLILPQNITKFCRGINEFKEGYQPRINIIKDENGNLFADPWSVLNRWKIFFNQVLNVHGVHYIRQTDIHTAEPLVPEPSLAEVKFSI